LIPNYLASFLKEKAYYAGGPASVLRQGRFFAATLRAPFGLFGPLLLPKIAAEALIASRDETLNGAADGEVEVFHGR
jgi:hypothetical protein